MNPTDAELAARALYLSRWASKPTFVGAKARELMRRIGRELTARRVSRTMVVALVIQAKIRSAA